MARWLLEKCRDGAPLTETLALARPLVREAAERWPRWWDAELFGPPHREAEIPVLEALHDGLRRLKLARRRGRKLYATVRGRRLAGEPAALARALADDLGGGDEFTELVASALVGTLAADGPCSHEELVAPSLAAGERAGWRHRDGSPLAAIEISGAVGEILARGEAYGLIDRLPAEDGSPFRLRGIVLTPVGALLLGVHQQGSVGMPALVFEAELLNAPGVGARVTVSEQQRLTVVHEVIQTAFGWHDDHLYSFWLDGEFWGAQETQLVRPGTPDTTARSADVPLAELELRRGVQLAYLFDYGDEWRVRLTVAATGETDTGAYPRVLERRGNPPPQDAPVDERH